MPVHNLNFPHSRIIIKKKKNNNKKKKHPNKNPVIRRQWAEITEKKPATSRPGTTTKNKQQKKYVKKKTFDRTTRSHPGLKIAPRDRHWPLVNPMGESENGTLAFPIQKTTVPKRTKDSRVQKVEKVFVFVPRRGRVFRGRCVCVWGPPRFAYGRTSWEPSAVRLRKCANPM